MRTLSIATILLCVLCSSCVYNNYFLSPFHANNHPYRAMPMVADSVHRAVYASSAINIGAANDGLRDVVFNYQGSVHQAHTFKHFQFYYGANLSLGDYHIDPVADEPGIIDPNQTYLIRGDDRFFGGIGVFGGGNIVIPIKKTGSEWRVFGIESSYQREFGDYHRFRQQLPDSVVGANFRAPYYHTIGITTNAIKKFRKSGNTFGLKFGAYIATHWEYKQPRGDYPFQVVPYYLSHTLHFTKRRVTGFVQFNTGSYAANVQTGVNVRLGGRL